MNTKMEDEKILRCDDIESDKCANYKNCEGCPAKVFEENYTYIISIPINKKENNNGGD